MKRWLVALIPVALMVIARSGLIAESDVFWQARAGIDIIHGHPIIGPDLHSWTALGQTWTPNSWAWNVVLGFAYLHAGWAGLGFLILVTSAVIFGVVLAQALRQGADIWAACVATILGGVVVAGWTSGRPQVITYIAFLLIIWLNAQVLRTNETKVLIRNCVLIFVVQALAVNFHLGAALIPACIVAASSVYLLANRGSQVARALSPLLCALAGTFVSPVGFGVFDHVLFVRAQSAEIVEWQPGITNLAGLLIIAAGLWTAVLSWRAKRPEVTGLALLCTVLTATAIRFEPFVLLVAIPEFAIWFTHKGARISNLRYPLVAAWVVFCLCLAPLSAIAVIHPGQPASPKFSKAAVLAIPSDCRLFNSAFDGGLVDLLAPQVKVSMDGRLDFFAKSEVDAQLHALRSYSYGHSWLDEHAVNCVLLHTSKDPYYLISGLQRDPAWKTQYNNGNFVVLKRTDS